VGDRDFLFQEEETANLRDYWLVIRKYRWTIVIFLLLIVLIGALSVQGKARVYTATATLYIENQTPNIMGVIGATSGFTPGGGILDYYKTQEKLLKSRSLAAQVIQDLGLDHTQRFLRATDVPTSLVQRQVSWVQSQVSWVKSQVHRGLESMASLVQERIQGRSEGVDEEEKKTETFEFGIHPSLINRYLSKLSIHHLDETQIINVSFSSLDPSFSKKMANAHATTFIRTSLLTRFELTAEGRQFLEEKLTDLKAKLERSEENLNRFRKAHAIVSLEKGENLVVERLMALNGDLTQARSKRIELESLYRIVQQRDSRFLSQIVDNPLVRQIKDQISTLEMEKARLTTTFRPTYSGVTAFQEQIDQAKNRMDEEIRRIVHSVTSDYQAAKARERGLADEMEEQRRAALDLREKAVEAAILEREVEADRALYENILKRSKETDLTGAVPISNMRVVDRADVPIRPDNDRKNFTLLLSVLVGLLGGVGLAFIRYYLDNTLKTPEDIGRFLRLPTLGMVPNFWLLDKRGYGLSYTQKILPLQRPLTSPETETTRRVTSLHPLSLVGESYQTLCTALLFSLPERPPRRILVTSSEPLEGKTVTAMNIAVTLARNGAPVLLIDADLRNGHCHRLLSLENASGLTHALVGERPASEFIKKTAITNLSLLSRGAIPPNPVPLLGSDRMRQLLAALETDFSFIIIDSAPILPITDSVILSTQVDGVILVARAQATSRYVVRQACERLAYVRAKVLGVILNDIDMQSPEYRDYRNSYASYYAGYATAPRREGGDA
jgi:capsular exopolysaccharide synthesis family protein